MAVVDAVLRGIACKAGREDGVVLHRHSVAVARAERRLPISVVPPHFTSNNRGTFTRTSPIAAQCCKSPKRSDVGLGDGAPSGSPK